MLVLLQVGWVAAMAAAMVHPTGKGWGMAEVAMARVLMGARWAPLGRQVIAMVHSCILS